MGLRGGHDQGQKLVFRCGETCVFQEVTLYMEWCSARTKIF